MSVDCQGIREHAPTLQNRAGFSVLASRRSTLIYIACLRKRGVALKNGVPYLYLHTSTQTLHVSRLPGDQRTRSYPPKPRRFLHSASRHSTFDLDCMPFEDQICTEHRQVKNGLPYLCFHTSTQTLHVSRLPGDQRTRSHPPKTAQVSLRLASRHSTLIYIACLRKRGVALKNGVPYLYLHTSTQTLHVSRLPGDQRTRSYPPKPRRFLHSAAAIAL